MNDETITPLIHKSAPTSPAALLAPVELIVVENSPISDNTPSMDVASGSGSSGQALSDSSFTTKQLLALEMVRIYYGNVFCDPCALTCFGYSGFDFCGSCNPCDIEELTNEVETGDDSIYEKEDLLKNRCK
uniref:Nuclear receptor domain-containing protein n=1 Tax=Rhabditophanes sp. KR3021 TaxID=114890 RepID=A0AC35U7R6_9BILA